MKKDKQSLEQFRDRLKSLVPSGSGRDFAKRAGIGYSTFHNYLNAISSPTLENLVLLAKAGNVSVEWLATGKEFRGVTYERVGELEDRSASKIPFYEGDDFLLLDLTHFPNTHGNTEHYTALRVDTDVMEPTFTMGSILVIDQSQKHLKESKVIVMRKGGSYLYRRVQVVSNGYSLNSDNGRYNEMIVTEETLSSFEILGEVALVLNFL